MKEEVRQDRSAVVHDHGLHQPVQTGSVVSFTDKLLIAPEYILIYSRAGDLLAKIPLTSFPDDIERMSLR